MGPVLTTAPLDLRVHQGRSHESPWQTDPNEVTSFSCNYVQDCITQHASCSQVNCQRSLSSKIFESSQAVMKATSSSLGSSWKVRRVNADALKFRSCSHQLDLRLRWGSASLDWVGSQWEGHTPKPQRSPGPTPGRTSSPSPAMS